jgi:hypothetical protein
MSFLWIIVSLCFALEIPEQLTSNDQVKTLEVIGLGTATKFLSNAYPLGGYSGLEISMTIENLNTKEIANLGSTAKQTENSNYPTITIGKGIYNNSDIFFHFIPSSKTSGISKFGFSYRWSFYQAQFLPINFSLIAHGNSANLKNKIFTNNIGIDLITGLNLSQFSFFLGGGYTNSKGRFAGGTGGVTDTGLSTTQEVESSHFMFGSTYNFEPIFIGVSMDRYKDIVYSFKAGFLF